MNNSKRLMLALGMASGAGVVLFLIGTLRNNSLEYWYLPYNLVLALFPLLVAIWLSRLLESYAWNDWRTLTLLVVWLLFLPNSFYIVTDFIHLPETSRVDIVQDVVMLTQFSALGLTFGMMSLFTLHKAYHKQLRPIVVSIGVGVVVLLSSFAIYLGRELRWNSWDIVLHPIEVFSEAMMVINPFTHPAAAWMTLSFFMMILTFYLVWWWGVESIAKKNK